MCADYEQLVQDAAMVKNGRIDCKALFFTSFIQVEWIWTSTSVKMECSLLSKTKIEKVQYRQKTMNYQEVA